MMQAIYYTQTGSASKVLKVGDFEIPKLAKNDILLQMQYSSVNPADTKKRSGWLGASLDKEFIIPHTDGTGQIVEIGQAVDKSFLNKKVWVFGGSKDTQFGTCAEYFSTTLENVVELQEETSTLVASCLGVPVATAYYAVFSNNNPAGQIFFISGGAGAVSHYAIQFAKFSGAQVITTVSNDIKREICKTIGADLILNYKQLSEDEVLKQIIEFTKGDLVDRCIEVDFGFNVNLIPKLLKPNGTLSTYSSSSNPNPVFPYYMYAPKGINIKIVQAFLQKNSYSKKCSDFVNKLLKQKTLIHPGINSFDFSDTFKAHEAQENVAIIKKSTIKIEN